jgi:hypothetical protein
MGVLDGLANFLGLKKSNVSGSNSAANVVSMNTASAAPVPAPVGGRRRSRRNTRSQCNKSRKNRKQNRK